MRAEPEVEVALPLRGQGVYLLDDHEVVRRGLRYLLESSGVGVAGESASALEALRRIPALRPALVIVDDDLPDGSGAAVCRGIAVSAPGIRCLLMTAAADEAVLIESIMSGAWGCLSKKDDNAEQLRLISRALDGYTAFSGVFQPALRAPNLLIVEPDREEKLGMLTRQEAVAAAALGRGLSNRQISHRMFLSEKTVKNMISSILAKLGMERRSQVAVHVVNALNRHSETDGDYRSSRFPDLVAEVTDALLVCTSDVSPVLPTEAVRKDNAGRLAGALAATRADLGCW